MDLSLFFKSPVASCIFFITIITSIRAFNDGNLRYKFIFNPVHILQDKDWTRLFTSGLIHGSWMHLIFNMLAFYFFAFYLEQIIGHWQFGLLYVLSLGISSIPSLIRHKNDSYYNSLGASGAVSAVVFAMIFIIPDLGIGLLFIPGTIPGWLFALLFVGFSIFASMRGGGRINHDAHLWGALSGVLLTIMLNPQTATNFIQWLN
jgi:membrane associated rhomboid family serine protease